MMEKVFMELANGRVEFFTYAEGRRVAVSPAWVRTELRRGRVRLIALEPMRNAECVGC